MIAHRECYGKLYEPILAQGSGQQTTGAVFRIKPSLPGMAAVPPGIEVAIAAWDECMACSESPGCLQLSGAKLLAEFYVRH
ncbi:MAG: hypothetical protein JNK87_12740 [Bryobacterales bacterium]|nr:hypothetical protein [Bryobacterales bacterium]